MPNIQGLDLLHLDKKILRGSLYVSLCKTSDPLGQGHFQPQCYSLKTLVDVHKMKLHAKYQKPELSSVRQDFI